MRAHAIQLPKLSNLIVLVNFNLLLRLKLYDKISFVTMDLIRITTLAFTSVSEARPAFTSVSEARPLHEELFKNGLVLFTYQA